ncbi:MAG: hypothetical protein LBP56_05350 [Odoribacteraceae bacterium]|jgi:hypothetical protein|nr:hypothetical protein [Odoribacteraceae bacterium]
MKHVYYSIALLVALFAGCVTDPGNYTYIDEETLAPAALSGIQAEYSMEYSDTLRILPILAEGADEAAHDYLWYIYSTEMARDTIGREKELVYPVMIAPALNYRIALQITNKKTGLYKYYYTTLKVTTHFAEGWYVMKDIDGVADIDFIFPDGRVATDIIKNVNGEGVPGEGIACADARQITVIVPLEENRDTIYNNLNCLYLLTRSTVQLYNVENMELLNKIENLFMGTPPRFAPGSLSCTTDTKVLFNDSVSYVLDTRVENIGKWGVVTPGSRVDPVNMCRSYMGQFLVFDPDTRSLKQLNTFRGSYNAIRPGGTPPVNNMDYDMVFMREKAEMFQGGVAIMKNRGTGEYHGMVINGFMSQAMWEMPTAPLLMNPIATSVVIPAGSNVLEASVRGTHRNMDVLYFSKGDNEVWYYNLVNRTEAKVVALPSGEQVVHVHTVARYIDNKTYYNLTVLTTRNGNWTLRIYDYQASSPLVVEEPLAVYSGQGNPRHVFYRSLTSTTSF